MNVSAKYIDPAANSWPPIIDHDASICVVFPLMLLLNIFENVAFVRFVLASMVLYVNVALLKVAYASFVLRRMQLIMLAFVKFTPDKSVPDKS